MGDEGLGTWAVGLRRSIGCSVISRLTQENQLGTAHLCIQSIRLLLDLAKRAIICPSNVTLSWRMARPLTQRRASHRSVVGSARHTLGRSIKRMTSPYAERPEYCLFAQGEARLSVFRPDEFNCRWCCWHTGSENSCTFEKWHVQTALQ
jgi:hypothetical protein